MPQAKPDIASNASAQLSLSLTPNHQWTAVPKESRPRTTYTLHSVARVGEDKLFLNHPSTTEVFLQLSHEQCPPTTGFTWLKLGQHSLPSDNLWTDMGLPGEV